MLNQLAHAPCGDSSSAVEPETVAAKSGAFRPAKRFTVPAGRPKVALVGCAAKS